MIRLVVHVDVDVVLWKSKKCGTIPDYDKISGACRCGCSATIIIWKHVKKKMHMRTIHCTIHNC